MRLLHFHFKNQNRLDLDIKLS